MKLLELRKRIEVTRIKVGFAAKGITDDMSNNILILSCGTRDLLVRYFKRADYGRVIGADCSELAPALYEADKYYLIPRMKEEGYFDAILEICRKEGITAILPLQEDELNLISENRELFEQEGIRTIVSPVETLQICRDKYCFFEHMTEHGIPVLNSYIDLAKFEKAYEAGKIGFPVFVKPVRGAGSVGVMKVSCMELLKALFAYSEEPLLIQEFCNGREFGIDVYVDLVSGEVVDIFAKEKLRMRAGETEKSVTSNDPALKEFVYRAASTLKLSGPVDMDVFEKDGIFYLSEINPRFGGGFPHAYACGVDTPSYILQNLQGIANESHLQEKREEIYVLKYSDILCIDR